MTATEIYQAISEKLATSGMNYSSEDVTNLLSNASYDEGQDFIAKCALNVQCEDTVEDIDFLVHQLDLD